VTGERNSTDQLIDKLSTNLSNVKPTSPTKLAAQWSVATVFLVGLAIYFGAGVRPDLQQIYGSAHFILIFISLGALLFSGAFAAFSSALPGHPLHWSFVLLPTAFFALFVIALMPPFLGAAHAGSASATGLQCTRTLGILAFLPALLIFGLLRKMASTQPGYTTYSAALAALAVGALGLTLNCSSCDWPHLLLYHGLPILLIALLSQTLARRLLKW
jgi:hypothetical protein